MFEALFGKSAPDLKTAPLDPGTQKMISDVSKNADLSNADVEKKYNAGVAEAGNQALQSDAQGKGESAGLGMNDSMLQAIRNQYRGIGQNQIGRVTASNSLNTPFYKAQAIDMATKAQLAMKQVETQNYSALMQSKMNADMARAQTLYGVLSGAGNIAGAYIGSRARGTRRSSERPYTESDNIISNYGGQSYGATDFGGPSAYGSMG